MGRVVEFRRKPTPTSTGASGGGYTTGIPRSMAAAFGLEVDDATATRDRIMDEVKELADLLRGEEDVTMEEVTKLSEIHAIVSRSLGADPNDPL